VLERIADSDNSSPNIDFIMDLGTANIVGRDRTFPKVSVKSAFVMGFGETVVMPIYNSDYISVLFVTIVWIHKKFTPYDRLESCLSKL
jgi:hypothetical protein